MILSYAKTFKEKTREQLVKIRRKEKQVSDFSNFYTSDMKTKKKKQIYIAKTQRYFHNRPKALQLY